MPVNEAPAREPSFEITTTLSASDTWIETLTLKPIASPPGLVELVIRTQYLEAKNPEERRVKARCCITRERLSDLAGAIAQVLTVTGSRAEPGDR